MLENCKFFGMQIKQGREIRTTENHRSRAVMSDTVDILLSDTARVL